MNKENECEIVQDLAIPFIKKTVNQGSENFIKKHLANCDNCQKYYEDIKLQLSKATKLENDTDNIVINHFKKVKRRISILKGTLIIILIAIITAFSIIYVKQNKFSYIINQAYSKIDYVKKLDNYKLTVKTIQKNFKNNDYSYEYEHNYYYKDGKYKEEDFNSMHFYSDDGYDKINVYDDLKTIEFIHQDLPTASKGETFGLFAEIENYKRSVSSIYSLGYSVREERYNGIDCYVIRTGNNESYRDTWINKNNFITMRVVNEDYNYFYHEQIYSLSENVVTENDVDTEILNTEKYKDYTRQSFNCTSSEIERMAYELSH